MLYNLAVAVGGMVALVTLWVRFDLRARRVRALPADDLRSPELPSQGVENGSME